MINYIILSTELDVGLYYPYYRYNDILRYYNVENQLHVHNAVKDHYKLIII